MPVLERSANKKNVKKEVGTKAPVRTLDVRMLCEDDNDDNDVYNEFITNPRQKQKEEEEQMAKQKQQDQDLRTSYSLHQGAEKMEKFAKKNLIGQLSERGKLM